MKKNKVLPLLVSLLLASYVSPIFAKTLDELVEKEEGVEFGDCPLLPKPKIAGERIVAVIPARFSGPDVWVTHSILLVGLSKDKTVQGELELKVPQDLSPKEVISVDCQDNILSISMPGKRAPRVQSYKWDGEKLQKTAKAPGKPKK